MTDPKPLAAPLGQPIDEKYGEDCGYCGQPLNNGWNHGRRSGYGDFESVTCFSVSRKRSITTEVAAPLPEPTMKFCKCGHHPSWHNTGVCTHHLSGHEACDCIAYDADYGVSSDLHQKMLEYDQLFAEAEEWRNRALIAESKVSPLPEIASPPKYCPECNVDDPYQMEWRHMSGTVEHPTDADLPKPRRYATRADAVAAVHESPDQRTSYTVVQHDAALQWLERSGYVRDSSGQWWQAEDEHAQVDCAIAEYIATTPSPVPLGEPARPMKLKERIEAAVAAIDEMKAKNKFVSDNDAAIVFYGKWKDAEAALATKAVPITPDGRDWQHAFKNFHSNLCKRFGYGHDDVDWYRDLASLEEHIAQLKAVPIGEGELPDSEITEPCKPSVHESEGYSPSNRSYTWQWIYESDFDEYAKEMADYVRGRECQLLQSLQRERELRRTIGEISTALGCSESPDPVRTAKTCYAQWTRRIKEVAELEVTVSRLRSQEGPDGKETK